MQISTLNGQTKPFEAYKLWEWKLVDKTLLLKSYKGKSYHDQTLKIQSAIPPGLLCSHGKQFYSLQKENRIFII